MNNGVHYLPKGLLVNFSQTQINLLFIGIWTRVRSFLKVLDPDQDNFVKGRIRRKKKIGQDQQHLDIAADFVDMKCKTNFSAFLCEFL